MDGVFGSQWIGTAGVFGPQWFVATTPPIQPPSGGGGNTASGGSGGGGKLPRLEKLQVFRKIEKRKPGVSILEALRGPDLPEPPEPKPKQDMLLEQVNAIRVDIADLRSRLGLDDPVPINEDDEEADLLLLLSMLL